jgi:hypothetical protein
VIARYYVNVFPAVAEPRSTGAAVRGVPRPPTHACPTLFSRGVPELQPGAAAAAGLPVAGRRRAPVR